MNQIREGLDAYSAMGSGLARPWFLSLLAEVYAKCGRVGEGLQALEQAFTTVERTGERFYLAEIHRLQGELTKIQRGLDAATEIEAYYQRSLEVAREQNAASWELRTVVSLARLWGDLGRCQAAWSLLRPVYDRFTEGFDTTDLKAALNLLDELNRD